MTRNKIDVISRWDRNSNRRDWRDAIPDVAGSSRFSTDSACCFNLHIRRVPQVQNGVTGEKSCSTNVAGTVFKDIMEVSLTVQENHSTGIHKSVQAENIDVGIKDLRAWI